ncbi:MAG: hypothetical protein HYW63_00480 [Candidatus Levybacteria bacterium]|nr:hypothetical protein [Candidatus Levybacteria bacterium]
MNLYLSIPTLFIKFWYIDSPLRLVKYFGSVNHAVLQILSLPLMVRTFFKPLKNEYRKGLVAFSIGMGIFIKSILILVDLIIFIFVIFVELSLLALFLWWPVITLFIPFIQAPF